jgi:hypothetical protein
MLARSPRCCAPLLCFALLALPGLAEELGPNLVGDGGMETWNETGPGQGGWDYLTVSLKNWTFTHTDTGHILTPAIFSQASGDQAVCQRVEGEVHGGKYALRFSGGMYLNSATPDAYNTSEGQEYVVRYWVKGAGDTTIYLHVYGEGGPSAEILSKQGKPEPERWTLIQERLRVTGTGAATIYPRLTASAPLLVDDILIARVLKAEDLRLTPVEPDTAVRIAMAPLIAAPPQIDGRLDDAAWHDAVAYGGMRWLDNEQVLAPLQATFRVLHDNSALYLAIDLPEPGAQEIAAELKKNPPQNPLDTYEGRHSIEIFLQPPEGAAYYQEAYSLDGVRYDGRGMEAEWNGTWEAAVAADEQGWTVEMKVPVRDFGRERLQAGEEWGLNLCWNRAANYSTWSAVGFRFHNPLAFGKLVMSDWEQWVQASEAAWKQGADDLARGGPAVGLEVGQRLALLREVAAKAKTAPAPRTWEDLTRAYGRVQFVNHGYQALLSEIGYLTLFQQAGGKGK